MWVLGGVLAAAVTSVYFDKIVECLTRTEKLAHAAIPAILAVALLWNVIQKIAGDRPRNQDQRNPTSKQRLSYKK
jgi:hypothetical protein